MESAMLHRAHCSYPAIWRSWRKDLLEDDIVDGDNEMGELEKSHVDTIYKADLRAAYQFIRTERAS
jgi:hypothetical protein